MPTKPANWKKWEVSVFEALTALGGSANLASIYAKVEELRVAEQQPLNPTFHHTIRRTLQDSARCVQDVPHSGIWRLRRPEEVDPKG